MTISNADRLSKVHGEALDQFDRIQSAMRDERLQCLQDRRFYSIPGAQWEGSLGEQFENKPKFEINKVHLAVIRIINEYRNNRISVDYVAKDGTNRDDLADVCDGLYRADEQDSCADEAYDNAFEEAVGGGIGAMRLRAVYEDEEDPDNDHQRIRIEPIYDADTCVFFDLGAKKQDKSDAKHCFVLSSVPVHDFIDEWGEDPATWPQSISNREFDWSTPDLVFIAEYYRVEDVNDVVYTFENLQGNEAKHRKSELADDADEPDGLRQRLDATGWKITKERPIRVRKIHKYIMSGNGVMEDCGFIAGKCIPIIPTYGKRWFVDSVERCMGHVRLAKDSQRLKNMQLSKLGEISALSQVSKPILNPEQVSGHQMMWAEDNIKNYPYLLLNSIKDASGQAMPAAALGYTKPPEIPQAMAALLQITEQDMQDILGNPQNGDKIVSNISGKAVEMIQQRLDMQTFIYMSNFAKAVRRVGEVWLSMAKEIYVEDGRRMKTVGAQGEMGSVELMKPTKDENGAIEYENNLGSAKLDVSVEVGPSSSTRRDATVRSLINMLGVTQDPDTAKVLQAIIIMNMEGEGVSDVRDYFHLQLVKMGVLKPTDEEKAILAASQQAEDPNSIYLKAAADEATANATQSRIKTVETLASADLKRAQTAETLAGIEQSEREMMIKLADSQKFDAQAAARQDVIDAKISIPEAKMLAREGGAGAINPETGQMHFYVDPNAQQSQQQQAPEYTPRIPVAAWNTLLEAQREPAMNHFFNQF